LDTRQTGGCFEKFSKHSKKIMVDIDENEINKLNESGICIDIPVIKNIQVFLDEYPCTSVVREAWIDKLHEWKDKYTVEDIRYVGENNVYNFLELLDTKLPDNVTIVPDTGANLVWAMQTLKIKGTQRIYTNLGNSSMGFSLPCCIGSALSDSSKIYVCIIGDGGIQMNIQELKTVVDYKLPIKIFVINNSGYGIVKQFQTLYFESRYVGTEFAPPNFSAIASGYGMKAYTFCLGEPFPDVFSNKEPMLIDVAIEPSQKIYPKLEFGNSLEHMTPFVSIDDLQSDMIAEVPPRNVHNGWVSR
jgi:acetolactate synthase-1/2/3 large subunit